MHSDAKMWLPTRPPRSHPGVALDSLHFRYMIDGDTPPWRPLRAFDDGKKVYIEFPYGIAQGEMPPLFVIGPEGKTSDLVNYRVRGNHMIVDRLFAAAELRFGSGLFQQRVRIVRTDGGSCGERGTACFSRSRSRLGGRAPAAPGASTGDATISQGPNGSRGRCGDRGLGRADLGALSGARQSSRWRRTLQYREQDNAGWARGFAARLHGHCTKYRT